MKHLKSNNIVEVIASSENSDFPASQLLDNHPSRKYRAITGEWTSKLTAYVVGGCSDIVIAGTNATDVSVTARDPNVMDWGGSMSWGGSVSWANVPLNITVTTMQDAYNHALIISLAETISVPCILTFVLSGPSAETLEAGVMTAYIAETYGTNPRYGLTRVPVDYSIEATNSNGSLYYKKRDTPRSFRLNALMLREKTRVLESFYRTHGKTPTAWKLTDENSNDFVVFGYLTSPPTTVDSYPNHSEISWSIIEAI